MINSNISQQGRARILINEGYNFKSKKSDPIEDIIAHCIISTERSLQSLFKHIHEHVYLAVQEQVDSAVGTNYKASKAIYKFVKKYNLKKYYKKHIDNYRSSSDNDYMKIIRHYYNFDSVPIDIMIMEYAHFADRSKTGGKLMSDSLYSVIATAINDEIKVGHDYQIGRAMISYLERSNRYFFDKQHDRAFTIKKDGRMRFTPKNAQIYITDTQWSSYKRSNIKYGKGIRKIFKPIMPMIEDRQIEALTNNLKSKYIFDYEFMLVTGEDIRFYYHKDRQSDNAASLSASCMRHESCQNYLDIYAMNDNDIDMLIAISKGGLVHGRALIWKQIIPHNAKEYPDNIVVMDRIYGKDMTIQAFKDYAHKNNMWHKRTQSYSDAMIISPVGQSMTGYKTRPLNNTADEFPYLDTLKYTNDDPTESDKIVLNTVDGDTVFDCTDGCYNSDEYYTDIDGDRIHADDACWDEMLDEYYHTDSAVWCDTDNTYAHIDSAIRFDDEYWHPDSEEILYSAYNGDYIRNADAVYSEYEDSYIHIDDIVECVIHSYIHSDNSKIISIDDNEHTVHDDVTEEELINHLGL